MTWPIPPLATNRTNDTPQFDTHPADHNAIADAIGELSNRMPRGLVASGRCPTTDQTLFSTPESDIVGLTATFTVVAGRKYLFRAQVCMSGVTAPVSAYFSLTNAANGVLIASTTTLAALETKTVMLQHVFNFAAGSYTVKGRLINNGGGGGTITVVNTASRNGWLTVEDVGI